MGRWFALLIIGWFVVAGTSGCVLVVADDDVSHEIRAKKNRSRLARDIADDIARHDALMHSDITVREDDGIVILHGEAESVEAIGYAIDVAARHAGVVTVISHLTVEYDI